MDTRVKFINRELYKYKSCTVTKFKTYLHSEGYPTNTIRERVFFNFIFPITPMGYNSLKGYISWTDYKGCNIKIKLIKSKDEAVDYII